MQIHKTKSELRKELREKRHFLATNQYSNVAGEAMVNRIIARDEFIKAKTVIMFYPVGDEANILSLFEISRRLEKKVAFPCSLDNGRMIFKYASDLSQLSLGAFNIPEPQGTALEPDAFASTSLCIVPALAIDHNGHRIGYGGGYYDRFLAQYKGASIGITYDDLIIESIIPEDFDIPVDLIITERRTICPQKRPRCSKK